MNANFEIARIFQDALSKASYAQLVKARQVRRAPLAAATCWMLSMSRWSAGYGTSNHRL
ncbi:MAG: hypothetical protein JO340_16175 [Acidobacteriaceae bacterium]|nr:hypothetical protein [Acidobacteriaceae bacterium]